MQKIVSWLLIVLAFVPLVVFPNTLVPFVGGKVFVYRGVAFIVALLMMIMLVHKTTRGILSARFEAICRKPLFIAMAAGTILLPVSTIFAFDRYVAFFGEPTRGEGFITLFAIYILYVAVALFFQKKEWNRFFIATAITSMVLFMYQLWQAHHGINRPSATLGNPIFLSGYYLFSLLAGSLLFFKQKGKGTYLLRSLAILSMGASVIGIFLTETRGTIAGLLLAIVVSGIVVVALGKGRKIGNMSIRTIGMLITGSIIVAALFFASTYKQTFWQSVPGVNRIASGDTTTLNSRIIYLDIVKNGFLKSSVKQKIVGWGWDNFSFFSNKNYEPKVYAFDVSGINRAHNKLADMLIMTGVLGLIAYLAIWFLYIKQICLKMKENFGVGLAILFVSVSYFVHNFFAFDVPVTLFYFYAVLAMLTQYTYEHEKK